MSSRSHIRFNTITKNASSTCIAIHSLIAFQNTKQTPFENETTNERTQFSDFVFDWRNDIMFSCGVAHVLCVTKSTIEIIFAFF